MTYRGLILDFGGVLTIQMRLNGQAFERSEGLAPGTYTHALNEHPDGVAIYKALEVGEATQEQWNQVIGGILGIDPTDLMRRALANLHLEPRMVDAARRARTAGIKVAMLSNSFGITPSIPTKHWGCGTGSGTRSCCPNRSAYASPIRASTCTPLTCCNCRATTACSSTTTR